jgi:hypothetical protein
MQTENRLASLGCSLLAIALVGLLVASASAGDMTLYLTPVERLDSMTFDPLPFVLNSDGRVANGQPGLYVMQVTFTAEAATDEKGWAGTAFDVAITSSDLSKVSDSYDPNLRWYCDRGIGNCHIDIPIYQINQDAGTSGDLNNITVAIASPKISNANAGERRNYLGTQNAPAGAGVDPAPAPVFPSWLGNFSVEWDGVGSADVLLANHLFAFTSTNGTPTNYTDDFFLPSVTGIGANFGFGRLVVPEPSSVVLVVMAAAGLFGGRQRPQA